MCKQKPTTHHILILTFPLVNGLPPLESHKLSLTGDKFSGNRESQQTRLASYLPAVTTPMLHSKAKKLQNFCRRTKFNGTHISQMQKERQGRGFPSPEFLHLSCITSTKHDLNEDGIVYWKSCCQVEAGFVLKNGVEDYKLKLLRHLKFILRAGEKITDKWNTFYCNSQNIDQNKET